MPLGKHQLRVKFELTTEGLDHITTHQAAREFVASAIDFFDINGYIDSNSIEVTTLNPDTGLFDPTMNV